MRTLQVERHETRAYEPKEYETAMVQPRNKNDRIWTALRLKMEGIEHELEDMGRYLMKSTTHCLPKN